MPLCAGVDDASGAAISATAIPTAAATGAMLLLRKAIRLPVGLVCRLELSGRESGVGRREVPRRLSGGVPVRSFLGDRVGDDALHQLEIPAVRGRQLEEADGS